MALWSLVIDAGGRRYSTQVEAAEPRDAVAVFLAGESLASFLRSEGLIDWPTDFGPRDVTLMMPMKGLFNMFICDLGRGGNYVSIILVRTETNAVSNAPLNTDSPASRLA